MNDAKLVLQHFQDTCNVNSNVKQTMIMISNLLKTYSKDEIIGVIDYLVHKKKANIFSFGYVVTLMSDSIRHINLHKQSLDISEQIATMSKQNMQEVKEDSESSKRNANKSTRFGIQPRFGKKLDFNLFEES
jgi:hypothetical protein